MCSCCWISSNWFRGQTNSLSAPATDETKAETQRGGANTVQAKIQIHFNSHLRYCMILQIGIQMYQN